MAKLEESISGMVIWEDVHKKILKHREMPQVLFGLVYADYRHNKKPPFFIKKKLFSACENRILTDFIPMENEEYIKIRLEVIIHSEILPSNEVIYTGKLPLNALDLVIPYFPNLDEQKLQRLHFSKLMDNLSPTTELVSTSSDKPRIAISAHGIQREIPTSLYFFRIIDGKRTNLSYLVMTEQGFFQHPHFFNEDDYIFGERMKKKIALTKTYFSSCKEQIKEAYKINKN